MSPEKLHTLTKRELVELARSHKVSGWHGMKKQELIEALASSRGQRRGVRQSAPNRRSPQPSSTDHTAVRASQKPAASAARNGRKTGTTPRDQRKLTPAPVPGPSQKDAFDVEAIDAHWIHLSWALRRSTIDRAQASLGIDWHAAQPVIRIFDVTADDSRSVAKLFVDDVAINGTASHWFIPVPQPGRAYRFHLGLRTSQGRFHALVRSARLQTHQGEQPAENRRNPASARRQSLGSGRFSVAESQRQIPHLKTPVITSVTQPANGEDAVRFRESSFPLTIHVEATISGKTDPAAQVSILEDQIPVAADGTFAVRVTLPEGRQVLPAVAVSPDGTEIRTVVLALERNTKELEPQTQDDLIL